MCLFIHGDNFVWPSFIVFFFFFFLFPSFWIVRFASVLFSAYLSWKCFFFLVHEKFHKLKHKLWFEERNYLTWSMVNWSPNKIDIKILCMLNAHCPLTKAPSWEIVQYFAMTMDFHCWLGNANVSFFRSNAIYRKEIFHSSCVQFRLTVYKWKSWIVLCKP